MKEQRTIILVHGLWESSLNLRYLGARLKRAGLSVQYFNYPSVACDLAENVKNFHAFINKNQSKQLVLAGHSLGGLIILELLNQYPANNISRSILFGTPVNGSAVARSLGRYALGKKIFGKNFELLCEGLKATPEQEVGVISGSGGKGLGQFFAVLTKPHDGAVSEVEAVLKSGQAFLSLPTSHFTMLFSRRLAFEIAYFAKHGRFSI